MPQSMWKRAAHAIVGSGDAAQLDRYLNAQDRSMQALALAMGSVAYAEAIATIRAKQPGATVQLVAVRAGTVSGAVAPRGLGAAARQLPAALRAADVVLSVRFSKEAGGAGVLSFFGASADFSPYEADSDEAPFAASEVAAGDDPWDLSDVLAGAARWSFLPSFP